MKERPRLQQKFHWERTPTGCKGRELLRNEVLCEQVYQGRTGVLTVATEGKTGDGFSTWEPQVKAVGFRYNAEFDTIDIGGFEMEKSQNFRTIANNPAVSFLVADVLPDGSPGFIEIRGYAQALASGGQSIDPTLSPAMIRIIPRRIIAWDRSGRFSFSSRNVEKGGDQE